VKFSKYILSLDSPFSMFSWFNAIRDNEYPIDFNKLPKMVIYDGARPFENLSARALARIDKRRNGYTVIMFNRNMVEIEIW
jgi:hypothetical protein